MGERLAMPAQPHRSPWALRLHVAFDATHAEAVLRACSETLADAPKELRAEATLRPLPNERHVPPALRGRAAVIVDGLYHGHLQDGYALLRRLRTIATPLLDRTAPVEVR
jgi:hypothetical protein